MPKSGASTDGLAPKALRVVSTAGVRLSDDGFVSWVPPTPCDSDGNVYILLGPHATVAETKAAAKAGRDLPLDPRQVLRVSADGKTTLVFDPAKDNTLAGAKRLTTVGTALDAQGTPSLLVWAEFETTNGEKAGAQYIVSFNGKGEYRSESKIDEQEILVQQFEVLGGGQYVLRGLATHSLKPRMAILSGESGLVNVETWPSTVGETLDAAMAPREFTQMVRGGDGRVYVSVPDTERGKSVVYSVGAAGELEEAFELRRMPRHARLIGLLASGNRLAAAHLDGTGGQRNGNQRSWIDTYDATSGDLLSTYGPASPSLLCYVHTGSEDRFVFLEDGKLVTMAP